MVNMSILIPKRSNVFNSHEDVRKICEPIFQLLELTFFRYLRIYKDLSRIHLCTHPEWSDNFYSKGFYNIAWFDAVDIPFELLHHLDHLVKLQLLF